MSLADTPRLTTERLTLRAPKEGDRALYAAFYASSDLTVGSYRGGRSADEIVAILNRDRAHWQRHGYGMFLLEDRATGSVLGGAGLVHPEGLPGHELTWWLLPHARGKGFALEASLAVVDWAHDGLGWTRVETFMRDENTPARRLATRIVATRGGRQDRRETFPDSVTRDVFVLSERVAA